MSEWTYIAAAYGLTWLTLSAYALHLRSRARRAARTWITTKGTGTGAGR